MEWGGNWFAVYSLVCFIFSLALPGMARRLGRKYAHTVCLLCGALGLISVATIHNKYVLLLTMVGVGKAWVSTLSMPYAVLAASLPPAEPASTWASSTSSSSRRRSWHRSSSDRS